MSVRRRNGHSGPQRGGIPCRQLTLTERTVHGSVLKRSGHDQSAIRDGELSRIDAEIDRRRTDRRLKRPGHISPQALRLTRCRSAGSLKSLRRIGTERAALTKPDAGILDTLERRNPDHAHAGPKEMVYLGLDIRRRDARARPKLADHLSARRRSSDSASIPDRSDPGLLTRCDMTDLASRV